MVRGRLFNLEAMTVLRVVNVVKAYGPRVVLQGITLAVARGDRIGVVGANGNGKSTLLRVLAGEPPDAGSTERLPGVRVGLLPQVLPSFEGTLWEAALGGAVEVLALRSRWEALAARLADVPGDEHLLREYGEVQDAFERAGGFDLEHRAREALGGLGLGAGTWERPVRVLSGGERTRLNLARLLLQSPDVLLLDEPTNHLDIAAIEWLEGFLRIFPGAAVVVSQDRRFLNVTVTRLETQAPERPRKSEEVRVRLPSGERGGPALAHLRGVEVRFGDRTLFSDVNLTLRRGDRVGLVGPNGSGKTTLLRVLAGQHPPTTGVVWRGPGVVVGVLEQEVAFADARVRPIDLALDCGLDPPEARAVLASLLFRGDRVFEPVEHLSGGERTRLALLMLIARRTTLLLLDEPTNHLDLPSRERFEEALLSYAGTLVVASHDRYLLDRLCTCICALQGNTIAVFEGTYSAFRSQEAARGGTTS